MTVFFYICEYLEISPRDFFDYGNDAPVLAGEVAEELKKLDYVQPGHVMTIVKDILKKYSVRKNGLFSEYGEQSVLLSKIIPQS